MVHTTCDALQQVKMSLHPDSGFPLAPLHTPPHSPPPPQPGFQTSQDQDRPASCSQEFDSSISTSLESIPSHQQSSSTPHHHAVHNHRNLKVYMGSSSLCRLDSPRNVDCLQVRPAKMACPTSTRCGKTVSNQLQSGLLWARRKICHPCNVQPGPRLMLVHMEL
jgi:hypothetical protein